MWFSPALCNDDAILVLSTFLLSKLLKVIQLQLLLLHDPRALVLLVLVAHPARSLLNLSLSDTLRRAKKVFPVAVHGRTKGIRVHSEMQRLQINI
jgi:hypothetical protein